MSWQSTRFQLYALVDEVEMDVVQATVTFELNNIPRCTIMVPVGREVETLAASAIHKKAKELTQNSPFELWLRVTELGRNGQKPANAEFDTWPPGAHRIFRGYVTGSGFRRNYGGSQFVIHAKHWLLDLDYTSTLSATSHPENPSQFTYRASAFPRGTGGTEGTWGPFGKDELYNAFFLSDFWEKGLKPVFEDLAKTDTINSDELPLTLNTSSNASALRALANIKNGVALKMQTAGADTAAVSEAIYTMLQAASYVSFANHTLWDKLINEFAPMFMFSLVPRVEDAVIIPFVPGLREPYITIRTTEYDSIDLGAELYRRLQAVGILAGIRSDTNASLHVEAEQLTVGGWYQPDEEAEGMILLKNGPPWLSNPVIADRYVSKATGRGQQAVGNAMAPGEGQPPDKQKPGAVIKQNRQLIDNYAHYLYMLEALKQRQGSLSGKVRFDIAPGSTVEIEGPSELFIPNDTLGQTRFACVTRVTTQFNAEAQMAGTGMEFSHIRDEAENESDATSVDKPPLWEEGFPGTYILEAFADQSR